MEIHFLKLTVLDALVIDGKRYKNVKAFKFEILEDGEVEITFDADNVKTTLRGRADATVQVLMGFEESEVIGGYEKCI